MAEKSDTCGYCGKAYDQSLQVFREKPICDECRKVYTCDTVYEGLKRAMPYASESRLRALVKRSEKAMKAGN